VAERTVVARRQRAQMTRHCAVVLEAATKLVRSNSVQASRALPLNRPNCREVLECGGWWGTGLTPLWMDPAEDGSESGVCPHPSPTAVQDAGARLWGTEGGISGQDAGRFRHGPLCRTSGVLTSAASYDSRTTACKRCFNCPTTFSCAVLTSASVSVRSACRYVNA
jgi:hypothetical protein